MESCVCVPLTCGSIQLPGVSLPRPTAASRRRPARCCARRERGVHSCGSRSQSRVSSDSHKSIICRLAAGCWRLTCVAPSLQKRKRDSTIPHTYFIVITRVVTKRTLLKLLKCYSFEKKRLPYKNFIIIEFYFYRCFLRNPRV